MYRLGGTPARPVDPPSGTKVPTSGTITFTLKMNVGDVTITMDRSLAPCAINSFESLARQGFYDNTRCHRLIDVGIFILQCGDPTGTGTGGPGYSYNDELKGITGYPAGTVAMFNRGPNTNGSQFFLVYSPTTLDFKYTVLGRMDPASTSRIGLIADQGQDGTGKPNNPAQIFSVVIG